MIKISTLKIEEINHFLQENNVQVSGSKSHKVNKLLELLGTDEVDPSDLKSDDLPPNEDVKLQISELKSMVAELTKAVENITLDTMRHETLRQTQPPQLSTTLIENNQSLTTQSVCSTRDIIGILPEYDPLKKMISSSQLVQRVEQLQRAYSWSEDMVLFAVQHKMKGVAKDWLDGQPVFQSWAEFVGSLISDFPTTMIAAELHRELTRRRRKPNETFTEYYYSMLALARRGLLDDKSINSYIISGLNELNVIRTLLALNIPTCSELLASLENLSLMSNTSIRFGAAGSTEVTSSKQEGSQATSERRGPKCYNCNEWGHISVKFPRPQRRLRCDNCSKIGHSTKNCRLTVTKSSVSKINNGSGSVAVISPVMKHVLLEGRSYSAFVDTGSDHSLIRDSTAPKGERKKSMTRLKGFGGSIVESEWNIETMIEMDQNTFNVTFCIVPDEVLPFEILLGRDVLCREDQRIVIEAGELQLETLENNRFQVSTELNDIEREEVYQLINEYGDCFAEDISSLGRCKTMTMKIDVTTAMPIVGKRYQVAFAQRGKLSEILRDLQINQIIRTSISPHAASVLLVNKSNGESRMCIDYRALNAVTVKKQYQMPVVEEQLSRLSGNTYFTKLDMTAGYYQIPLEEESKPFTAFLTHEGLYEYNVMPFGLVNAPMWFQEMIVNIIKPLRNRDHIVSYVDEVIIRSSFQDQRAQQHQIAHPLTKLLGKNGPYQWQKEQENAFTKLKVAITSKPVLTLFDINREHEVHTDASCLGLSGILMQREANDLKPVFYYSRQCTDAETRYASHELEILAIVETLQRFRLYLLGTHFRIVTDCNAIVTTKATSPLPPRVARWWLKLQEFDFECVYRPGAKMSHVDGMSRAPTLPPNELGTVADNMFQIMFTYGTDWVVSMQLQDDQLREIVEMLNGKEAHNQQQVRSDYVVQAGRLYRKVENKTKLVIPHSARWRISKACHDDAGYFGVEKTLERMAKDFWFPRMWRYIKSYIDACPECCLNKAKGGKPEGQLHVSEVLPLPFRSIHMDHLGPFPKSKQGNSYIIVLVCAFSKYVVLKALRNTKTTPVLNVLREVMVTFGQPLRIITDRGTAFTSKEFDHFMNEYGIQHIKTAVRTPRANGQAESVNKTVLSSLKCSTKNEKDWDTILSKIQWCINSQQNSITKFSPNELIFNYNQRDVTDNRIIQAIQDDYQLQTDNGDDLKQQTAARNIDEEKRKWKLRFDAKHQKPKRYAEGDLVVIDNVSQPTGGSHKLDPLFKEPYAVTKVLDCDRYVVEDFPDTHRTRRRYTGVMSSDHMKPWCMLRPEMDVGDVDDEMIVEPNSSRRDEPSGRAKL